MRYLGRLAIVAFALTMMISGAEKVHAEVSAKDMKVITRALGFLENKMSGDVKVGIVYNASDAASKADADSLKSLLGDGLSGKGMVLKPVMVSSSDLSSLSSTDIAFVASGMSGHYDKIKDILASGKKFSVTTDRTCVEQGGCAMFVTTSPKVEIVVNKSVADATGVSFQSVFRMMITEM